MKKSFALPVIALLLLVSILSAGCEVTGNGTSARYAEARTPDFLEVGGEYVFTCLGFQVRTIILDIDESGWVFVEIIGGEYASQFPGPVWINTAQLLVIHK